MVGARPSVINQEYFNNQSTLKRLSISGLISTTNPTTGTSTSAVRVCRFQCSSYQGTKVFPRHPPRDAPPDLPRISMWTSFLVYHKTFFRSIGKVVFFFGKSWILSIAISGIISMRRLLTTFRTIYPFKNQKNQTLPQYSCKTDFPNDSRLLPWKSYFSGMKSMAFSFRRVWRFETPHHRLSPGCLSRSGINSVGSQEFSSTTLQPRYSHVLTHGFPRKFKNSGVENPKFMDILGQFKKLFFCELRAISPKQCVEKDH